MHERLAQKLTGWKLVILEIGLFVLFVVTFGDYLLRKLWSVLGPLVR
jgi:hypothetical protein